ncbi:MAG TPA: inosine/xanthosine triphosphatase, partial [Methanomassiliicoccales archaeon]|nr:inosine/xanthosine triphosphatase [Methanomassiliicoccales archaeon]
MINAGVGGTFNTLHRGHRALIDRAFALGDVVHIGLMSDRYVHGHKNIGVPYAERFADLDRYAASKGKPYSIVMIEDGLGNAVTRREMDLLIVSPESAGQGDVINAKRKAQGVPPLRIVVVPYVLADDFCPVSSSRVLSGEIDREGRLLRPLRVGVGSTNPVKAEAVRSVLSRLFDRVEVAGVPVVSGVGHEPFGKDVLKGATERAKQALPGHDLGIGIEAGIFEDDDGLYDVQQCAVIDRMGSVTHGHGPGFRYPPVIERQLREGKSVGQACDEIFSLENNGHKGGAIGILTNGILKRKELTEQSVLAAMVPRIRK